MLIMVKVPWPIGFLKSAVFQFGVDFYPSLVRSFRLTLFIVEDSQTLDNLKVERERGITVKSVSASMNYTYKDGKLLYWSKTVRSRL